MQGITAISNNNLRDRVKWEILTYDLRYKPLHQTVYFLYNQPLTHRVLITEGKIAKMKNQNNDKSLQSDKTKVHFLIE